MKLNSILITLLSLACLAGARLANAGTHVWSGALNGYWSNPANWSSGGAPSAIEATPVVVQFPSTASVRRESTNDLAYLKLDVLAFYGANYRLYGEESTLRTLTLTGSQPPFPYAANLISGYSATNYIDWWLNLALPTNVSILVGSGATLKLDASLIGPGGFTKTGTGTLWLSGDIVNPAVVHNSFLSPARVLEGTVKSDAWGYNDYFDYIGHPVVTIPGELIIGDTDMTRTPKVQAVAAGQLGGGALTINPNGLLEVYATNSIGSLAMTGGKVQFVPDYYGEFAALHCGTNITSYPTRLSSAKIAGQGDLEIETAVVGQPSFINVLSEFLVIEANISGNTTLSKIGPGELDWSGNGEYFKGPLLIKQGHLAYSGQFPFTFPADPAYTVTVSNDAQLTLRSACSSVQSLHLNGFGLGGTNGALVIEHDGANFAASMQFDSDTAIVVTNAAHTFTVNGTYAGGIYQHFQGPGNLFKKGPGTLKITGDQTNSMTGKFYVEQGTLALDNKEGVAAISTPLVIGRSPSDGTTAEVRLLKNNQMPTPVPITINDSGTLNLYGFNQTAGPLTLQGGDIKTFGGVLTLSADVLATNGLGSIISGNVSLGSTKRTFHVAPGYNINIQAQVSDNSTLVGFDKLGAGSLTLSGSNTFFGLANVLEGLLYARNDHALGNTSMHTIVANGARLAIDGRNLGAEGLILSGDGGGYGALSCGNGVNVCNGVVNLYADATINVAGPNDRLVLGGLINGPGGVTKVGAGTLAFFGNSPNAYMGLTTVSEGGLELARTNGVALPWALIIGDDISPAASAFVHVLGANQIANYAPVTIHSSGLLDLSGLSNLPQTIGSLSGTGPLQLGLSTLTVGGDNLNTTYSGSFNGFGASGLVKVGTGKWTVIGNGDQFLGTTKINNGALEFHGWMPSSAVTVNSGASLQGDGTVGDVSSLGGTIYNNNFWVHPIALKNLSLDSASTLRVDLISPQATGLSRLSVVGAVNLGNVKLDVSVKYPSTIGTKFQIITNDGNDMVSGTFKDLSEGATFVRGTNQFQITYKGGTGNDVVLTHIGNAAAPHISSVESLPNGQKKITGTGFPGLTYTVDASTDLKTWISIGTATAASPGGELVFIDPDAPNFPYRFYRFLAP